MKGYWEGRAMERDALWARRDAVEEKINKLSLAMFRGNQFADLAILYDRKAVSERSSDLVKALERLEAFLEVVE